MFPVVYCRLVWRPFRGKRGGENHGKSLRGQIDKELRYVAHPSATHHRSLSNGRNSSNKKIFRDQPLFQNSPKGPGRLKAYRFRFSGQRVRAARVVVKVRVRNVGGKNTNAPTSQKEETDGGREKATANPKRRLFYHPKSAGEP